MTRYGGFAIRAAARRAGFSAAPMPGRSDNYSPSDIIAAIALAESGGDDQATANTSAEYSVGVYQINLHVWGNTVMTGGISEAGARDLETASHFVYDHISNHGTNFQPWTMYKNGQYLNHLPLTGVAESGPIGSGDQPGASPVDSPSAPAQNGSILGVPLPSQQEVIDAAIVVGVALLSVVLVTLGIYGFVTR